jgi:hypothetical protein
MHRLLAALALSAIGSPLAFARAGGAADFPAAIPAHWVENDTTLEPRGREFQFNAVSFSSPEDGWIVGTKYLLHIRGNGRLELTFTQGLRPVLGTAQALFDGTLVAGGFRILDRGEYGVAIGLVLRSSGGRSDVTELSDIPLGDWLISVLRIGTDGNGWALGTVIREAAPPIVALLRLRDGVWKLHPLDGAQSGWNLIDLCLDQNGDGWSVGVTTEDGHWREPLVVRLIGERLEEAALPSLPGPHSVLSKVACLPGGGAVAVGRSGIAKFMDRGDGLVLRYDGAWHEVELPDSLRGFVPTAMSAASERDIWMSGSIDDACRTIGRPCRATYIFVHWHDDAWELSAPPSFPGSRAEGYLISDLTFVSPDEGWAVANDYAGPEVVRGLIFHYKDGIWRHRNWNWHFWNQPWFGLFGD